MEASLQSQLAEAEPTDCSAQPTTEQQLWAAVIRRAVWDFVLYRDCEDEDRLECANTAAGWLFWDGTEKIDAEGRMSFLYICSSLNLRPSEIRKQALRMCREDVKPAVAKDT